MGEGGSLRLDNDVLAAEFSAANGAITGLVSKQTGWRIHGRPTLAAPFRLMAPLPGRRHHMIEGAEQPPPEVAAGGSGRQLTFYWKTLRSRLAGELAISFRHTITVDETSLTFRAAVRNDSPYVIENVSFPSVGDVAMPVGQELSCMAPGYAGMVVSGLLPRFDGSEGYFGFDWPFKMVAYPNAPFALVASDRQGLYVGCHDTQAAQPVRFAFYLRPGFETAFSISSGLASPTGSIDGRPSHLELVVWQFPYAAPGETIELAPIVLAPYAGPWPKGADIYKRWRRTWFRRPDTPAWARDVHSWQQVHINSPEDELRCRYEDLTRYGKDCARHGVAAIQLVGWNRGGQDRGNPSHDTDLRLGTWEQLRDAIRRIQEMGVEVVLFSKFTWADRSQDWFRDELVRYASKDPYGDYHVYPGYRYQTPTQLADLNTRRLVPMCPNCRAWRQIASEEFRKTIALGAAGMLYDESQHHGGAFYCFDPAHDHRVPAHLYAGDAHLAEEFRQIATRENPEFLFAGEACYDLQYRHYSVSYFRISNPNHLAVQRYIDPQAGIMVAVTGFNDRATLNQCLMHRYIISYEPFNFKGRLDDFPRTVQYGKLIDALRRRYRQFLWDGEYRDVLGAQVTANGKPYPWYSVFRHATDDSHAVVVANHSTHEPLEVTVELERSGRSLAAATPEAPDARPTDGRLTLPPLTAAVVMEQ